MGALNGSGLCNSGILLAVLDGCVVEDIGTDKTVGGDEEEKSVGGSRS